MERRFQKLYTQLCVCTFSPTIFNNGYIFGRIIHQRADGQNMWIVIPKLAKSYKLYLQRTKIVHILARHALFSHHIP